MKVTVYILCLFKFVEDNVVFGNIELESFNQVILDYIEDKDTLQEYEIADNIVVKASDESSVWRVYPVNQHLSAFLEGRGIIKTGQGYCLPESNSTLVIESAATGYYHHRLISRYEMDVSKPDFKTLREIRKLLDEHTNDIAMALVKEKSEQVLFAYTYPMLVVEGKRRRANREDKDEEENVFIEETTSLSFEVVEPCWWSPVGRTHLIRISIPGFIIYAKKGISDGLLRDLINAIYEYGLYEKKLLDNGKSPQNKFSEEILVKLWEHILDTIGGRTIDKYMAKITQTNYFIALLAFIVALSSAGWLYQAISRLLRILF